MGALLKTGTPVRDHGIYQSTCGCRTAMTLLVGQVLPQCLGCDEAVDWKLVQEVRSTSRPPQSRTPSATRLKAHRPSLDSASGED